MANYLPIATQITLLFDAIHHPSGRPYTMQEVTNETGISLPTISQLRNGKISNPQLSTLRGFCEFFHVPLRYFETKTVDECYAILNGDREKPTLINHEIAFRANALPEQAQRDILTMIKWVEAAEEQRKLKGDIEVLPGLEPYDEE